MNIFNINTTAFKEENFILLTDLSKAEIEEVIAPIVHDERNGGKAYNNENLIAALKEKYPSSTIEHFDLELESITV
jgi:hypothetical protein